MKPRPGDHRHKLSISGDELRELKKQTHRMAEAFGLDRKIEKYQGIRPITLYRWDLECLMDVVDLALKDASAYPDKATLDYKALQSLGERFDHEYNAVYGHEKGSIPGTAVTPDKGFSKPGQKSDSLKVAAKTPKKPVAIYQLKITLADVKPPVWRRVEVKDCTLLELNEIIQTSMGWGGYHMWYFDIAGEEYGDDFDGADLDFKSASRARLSRFAQAGVKKFRYCYDMGDNWDHVLQVEKVLEPDPQVKYPRCVTGSRACPPEDCGGPWGYASLLETIQNPAAESHEEMLEWVGGKFDPEAFDLEAINEELAKE